MPDTTIEELLGQAARLAAEGLVDEALELTRKAGALRKRTQKAEKKTAEATKQSEQGSEPHASARTVIVSALAELGAPVSPRAVADYARIRFGKDIDPATFASLRRDELRAYKRGTIRPVFIVPALDGRRFLAVRGKVALSEWPLERRLIGPWSERVDHLYATRNVVKQFAWLSRAHPTIAERFSTLVAAYATTVPGALTEKGEVDANQIERAVEAELTVLEPQDKQWRAEAAERAAVQLAEEPWQLLWGGEPMGIVLSKRA